MKLNRWLFAALAIVSLLLAPVAFATDVALTKIVAAPSGATRTLTAAVNGSHTVENVPGMMIEIYNASLSTRTVTFVTTLTVGPDSLAVADLTGTIATTVTKVFGPFSPQLYGPTLTFSLDSETSVSVAAIQLPQ